MVKMNSTYTGGLRCTLVHEPSGSEIKTDAPKDNMGRGEFFSPTDLVASALSSCILTTMAIVAERNSIAFSGASATVVKEMTSVPVRRIASLTVEVTVPGDIITQDNRDKLERAALHCPVHQSLHPDVKLDIRLRYL